MQRSKDGTLRSRYWYAVWEDSSGKTIEVSTQIEVRGVLPLKLKHQGDVEFERTRATALEKAKGLYAAAGGGAIAEEKLVTRLLEVRGAGERAVSLPLKDVIGIWASRQSPSLATRYVDQVKSEWAKFLTWIAVNNPRLVDAGSIRQVVAEDYLKSLSGLRPKTLNNRIALLSAVFAALQGRGGPAVNPFGFIQKRSLDTVSRKPFTPNQIERILSAAEKVSQWGDLVILMSSTALRRGDAATLTWDRVNLDRDQIQVRTQKTDEWVWLPIFPRMKASLLRMRDLGTKGPILPAVAPVYAEKPNHVDLQIRKILATAGFAAGRGAQGEGEEGIRVSVPGGQRRVSIAGSHAFRTTFITLALSAGVPIEIVRRITGHHTVEVVRQNYFAPDAEAIRSALTNGMPSALTGAKPQRDIGAEAATLFRAVAELPAKEKAARKKRLLGLWNEATAAKKKPRRGPKATPPA